MYLEKAKQQYQELRKREHWRSEPVAATPEQIRDLEHALGLKIPEAYQEFLLWIGGGSGLFAGDNYDWYHVLDRNRHSAIAILTTNGLLPTVLPDDAIVFIVYQGEYFFSFIRSSEGDNPPVHMFLGNGENRIVWNYAPNLEEFCLKVMRGWS